MSDWETRQFKEIFSIPLRNGLNKPTRVRGSGLPMVNMKEIFGFDVINDQTPMELVPVKEKERKSLLQYNDLLFARQSLVESGAGKVSIYKGTKETVFEGHLIRCRVDEELASPDFVYYLFKSPLGRMTVGTIVYQTAAAGIRGSELAELEFDFPPLPEQKAIAAVLSSLDDKIDLLQRQNATLETLAQTLFRQWFVEEAEDDWEEVELGEVIETTSGGTPSRKKMEYFENGAIRWVKSKELVGTYIFETEEKITETGLENSSAKLLPKNSILIAMYGATVGQYGILSSPATCNQAVCALLPNDEYPHTFLFMIAKENKENLINMAVGSAQQNISQVLIKSLTIPAPSQKIIDYHHEVEPLFEKIKSNFSQIRTLEKLRDTLLPKLMSGEARVRF